jgi:hypothetical protein
MSQKIHKFLIISTLKYIGEGFVKKYYCYIHEHAEYSHNVVDFLFIRVTESVPHKVSNDKCQLETNTVKKNKIKMF